MFIKVKKYKNKINVAEKECISRECFWPRPNPGVFVQGRGYRSRPGKQEWICGHRAIHGCPDKYCE